MCQFWGGSWVENHQAEMKSTGGKFFAAQKFRVADTHSNTLAALKTALQRVISCTGRVGWLDLVKNKRSFCLSPSPE
jgi:hypothetical protein